MPAAPISPLAQIRGRRPMRSESRAAGRLTSTATTIAEPSVVEKAVPTLAASPWKKTLLK